MDETEGLLNNCIQIFEYMFAHDFFFLVELHTVYYIPQRIWAIIQHQKCKIPNLL